MGMNMDVEASLYLMAHNQPERFSIRFSQHKEFSFRVDMEMYFTDLYVPGGSELESTVRGSHWLHFDGVRVVPENLSPKPSGEVDMNQVAAQFLDLNEFHAPTKEACPDADVVSFVFKPR